MKMSSIRRKTLFLIIAFGLMFPIFASNMVYAAWLPSYQITRNSVIEDVNPSVAIDPTNRSMVFTYTYYLPAGNIQEIMMSNNTEIVATDYQGNPSVWGIPEYDDEKQQISNTLGSVATIENDKSCVSVSASGEIWVVWQCRVNSTGTPETDTEIFVYYQNKTAMWIKQVTIDGTNAYNPQVVGLNGSYAYVAWSDDVGDIDYCTIINGVIGGINSVTGASTSKVLLSMSGSPNSETVHLSFYCSGLTRICYDNCARGGTFINSAISYTVFIAGTFYNVTMSAAGTYVLLTYQPVGGSIMYAYSSNSGSSFSASATALTAGTYWFGDPVSYITDFGAIEIFYTRQGNPSDIYYINNFAGSWSSEAALFGDDSDYNFYNPTIAHYNDTVVGLYNRIDRSGMAWLDSNLFAFGYQLMYRTSGSNYNEFELLDEDPAGIYLLEGISITYEGSVSSVVLNITYVDTVTLERYSNLTTVTASGGTKRYLFWDPNKYMTSNNTYNLSISLANTGTPILRVAINPWELNTRYDGAGNVIPIYYNISSDNEINGSDSIYNFQIGMAFEYSSTGRIQLATEGTTHTGLFSTTNYADYGYIQMIKNERYRFRFITTSAGHVRAFLFNDSIQTLDPSKALYIWDHSSAKTTSNYIVCNNTDTYYVLIQSETFGNSIPYSFYYGKCPGNITLNSPANNYYMNWITTKTVDLKWTPRLSDTDINLYVIQVSNDSTFDTNVTTYSQLASLGRNKTIPGTPENWLYWRIKAIDTAGNEGFFNTIRRFAFDQVTPNSPVFTFDNQVNDTITFNIRWQVPTDGAFTVDYYNVYRSTDPDFIPSSQTMITNPGTNTFPTKTDSVSRNDRYYYYVEAVDHVGHTSALSNLLTVTISYGGTVDAKYQDFDVQVGDILQYRVTWIESTTRNAYDEPLMTYRGTNYGMGSIFHFWVKEIDPYDVLPVRGDFYAKSTEFSITDIYYFMEEDMMLVPFVTTRNETYQEACFELYSNQLLAETSPVAVTGNKYYSTWNDGVSVRDVVCYNYHTTPDLERSQTSITFVVDRASGVLAEMIFWHDDLAYGYSLKLMDSSVPLSKSYWSYAPFIVPIFIGGVAAIVYAIMKKIQL